MDVDQESPENKRRDDASSTPGSKRDRNLSASDYAIPGDNNDILTTASKQRRGISGRSTTKTSTTTAATIPTIPAASSSSTSSSTARPAPARGDSNTSNEEMDRYGSHAAGSGSGGHPPTRSMPNPPGGEMPIKLTPITGRVSRAKKGVPVHTCELCRPHKTFTRAEHLRRHQLSHQTPGYPCTYPGCDRAFHRADLLARHATRHEQEGDKASSKDGNSRRTSTTSMSEGYGMGAQVGPSSQGPMPSQSDMAPGQGSSYPGGAPYQSYTPGSGSTPMSPPQPPRRESYHSTSSGPGGGTYTLSGTPQIPTINQPPSMENSPGAMPYDLNFQSPRTTSPHQLFVVTQGLMAHDSTPGLLPPDVSPWASSDSNFSTPSDNSRGRTFVPRGYDTPTSASDWSGVSTFVPTYTSASQDIHSPSMEVMASAAPYFSNPFSTSYSSAVMDPSMIYHEDSYLEHPHAHFPSVRSPTPPHITSSVQSAESLVTLAPAISSESQVLAGRFKDQAALMGTLSGAAFLTAITLPRPVRNAIPDFLDVYWKRFDTFFPLVHRRSFESAPNEVLRCAMAAVATQFLDGKEDRLKGNQLHEFAWQEVRRVPQWNVQTMQAILLCEFFARFRGRKAVIRPSSPFQSLYSRVDTTQNLDASFGPTVTTASHTTTPAFTARGRWAEWAEAEARRRLLAACFVLDVHTSVYYELPLMLSFTKPCPPIPLTAASQTLWNATTLEEWESLTAEGADMNKPPVLSEDVITPERVAAAPPLDQAVYLASEALRLPRRTGGAPLNLSEPPDLSIVERITSLFPGSSVANTYAALHYTPLHDLLAVSGDSWLFTQKVLPSQSFHQHQKQLKQWSSSLHAAVAAQFATKALIAFLDSNSNESPKAWNMNDISDYWAVYICSLICWALGHQTTRSTNASSAAASTTGGGGNHNSHHSKGSNINEMDAVERESETEALRWLHEVANIESAADLLSVVNARGRAVIIAVVAMVKRRLEREAVGGRNRLLVDALGVLRKLEEGVNWKWF